MNYRKLTPIERFATYILGKPLYPYQAEAANAILHSINHNLGWLITVMMSRQSGKNQLSAILEAFLLCTRREGVIVKAAPTFHPQVINSRRRLLSMLENPFCAKRVWTSYAQVGLAPHADSGLVRRHVGPSVMLCSADPGSNVVGATADLLLEIDEAQDVGPEKFDKDFRPMASTTNATTVLYGTAWSDDTLLARQRAINLEIERQTGERRHFEYDWRATAAANPHYKEFVQSEIARLGEQHLAIQTQYFLVPLRAAGHFFNDLQRQLLAGSHPWENEPGILPVDLDRTHESWTQTSSGARPQPHPRTQTSGVPTMDGAWSQGEMISLDMDGNPSAWPEPTSLTNQFPVHRRDAACLRPGDEPRPLSGPYPDACYIAGLDVGGEERANPADPTRLHSKRDSTVLSIGRVEYNELHLPRVEVVHQQWWTGLTYPEQYAALLALCEQWNIRRLVVDNTGQGAGLASLLIEKLGPERVETCTFTRPAKSRLGYQLLALINSGRFTLYAPENAPREIYDECWSQVRAARYTLPAPETINFYVDASEGHDDFLISLALCAQALHSITQPPAAEQIRPRRLYEGESRY